MNSFVKLDHGKEYLQFVSTIDRWKYLNEVENLFSKRAFKKFLAWTDDVERHESHRKTKQTNEWYLRRLVK